MAKIQGGDKMERALLEIAKKLSTGNNLKVGFMKKARYPDGTYVAEVAAANNFGTKRIPPRPFFSNMVKDKSGGWPKAIELNLKATGYDTKKTMELVGEGIVGQLKQSIIDTNSPPLAQSTIDRKGFEKPLIETSHMINSADKEVS